MRAGAAGVDHALGDALVVEVRDLLAQVVVLQQHRAALPGLQGVVGVGEAQALRGREVGPGLGARSLGCPGRLARRRDGLRPLLVRLGRKWLMRRGGFLNGNRRRCGRAGNIDVAF